MKKTLELCAAAFAAAMMASCASAPPQPDVPVASEATLVESYSPAEVTVRATGIGYGEENKAGADADLKRTAVQFVLLMGTDPIITTPEERMRFQNIEKGFYADVNRFITWEADKVESQKRSSFNGVPVLKRTKAVRVHKENLRRELTERGVLVARETLAAAQGNPVIMVIPDSPQGQTPLMVLDKNGLVPGEDVEVINNIQFNLMGGAFESGTGDFVTLFEPTATQFQNNGKGYIVANIGLESGEVPYTAFMARQETVKDDPELIMKFIRAIVKAQKWVESATDSEIAEAMLPFFPDSTIETLSIVAKSYRETDSWMKTPVMTEEAFGRLLDIMDFNGVLKERVEFKELVDNSFAEKAIAEIEK